MSNHFNWNSDQTFLLSHKTDIKMCYKFVIKKALEQKQKRKTKDLISKKKFVITKVVNFGNTKKEHF